MVSFELIKKEPTTPSCCMAIWLEEIDGTFFKTLYASDYLAYGGYGHEEICPDWVERSEWKTTGENFIDAVSGATPNYGSVEMVFEYKRKEIPPGMYKFLLEVHLSGEYNELYWGEIELGKTGSTGEVKVDYKPGMHEEIAGVLSELRLEFE